jgi:hypothetical protein
MVVVMKQLRGKLVPVLRSVLQHRTWLTPAKLPLENLQMHGVNIAVKCGCIVPSRAIILYMNGQLTLRLLMSYIYGTPILDVSRSQAAHLLRSWVRIPPGHGYLSVVSVVCCQVEVSATS